ncbi:MAG TPA: nitroreductase family deazaflavin-dependent oxidoreductase [Tepidiformaceae bacterium]|nr:nitroreductase family deazaflavin-dependent oxidoreductase [Tepidiformaceae bacterium]
MTTDRKPLPGWVTEHVNDYISTNGQKGHMWRGVPTLLLTTTGRKSGEPLLLPLIYGTYGESFLIVASKGGAVEHPAWYLNLAANPEVEVQVLDRKFKARARTATPEEKPALWETMAAIWPAYNDYQAKSPREIPVVVLDPINS